MKRRVFAWIGIGLVAAVVSLGAVGVIAAQTRGPLGPGGMMGYSGFGMMGPGSYGMMQMHSQADYAAMAAHHDQMLAAIAEKLGITVEELEAELEAGKTIPALAQERGVDLNELNEVMQAVHEAHQASMPQGMGFHMGTGFPGNGLGAGSHCLQ